MSGDRWIEVGDGVLVRRHAELDLNTGLVLGNGGCLVVDTRGDAVHGAELAAAVREITRDPWTVVITHAHFDHSFGTSAFLPAPVWAQAGCVSALREHPGEYREGWVRRYRAEGKPQRADALAATAVTLPDHSVTERISLRIGGRRVEFRYFGPGHTDHDLVVHIPDAGVVFAGDLVEHDPDGSLIPESFGPETSVDDWPDALTGLLGLRARVVVPGHGEPVDDSFVDTQRADLVSISLLRKDVLAGRRTLEDAARVAPVTEAVLRSALESPRR